MALNGSRIEIEQKAIIKSWRVLELEICRNKTIIFPHGVIFLMLRNNHSSKNLN